MNEIKQVAIKHLTAAPDNPFKVQMDAEMEQLIESIAENGVITPIIARETKNGKYEIISGHRRKFACEYLGLETVPAIVRELDRNEAVVALVDSNLQREHLLPSEKAFAYKLKLDALSAQGKRRDLTCGQVGHKSRDMLSETESGRQIQRYIRLSAFDGQHGLSAYNKTDQEKFEDADSTFISPKFVQVMSAKPVSEWIISVGRHEGFISSRQWIDTQNMLEDIAEKYNRPHRKTNALLSGLVYCPICGKRLRVISESNRWTNNKPRFKYVCPGYREKECTFQAVDGVLLDEFVVKQLSDLSDEDNEYFAKLLNARASDIFSQSQNEQELTELKKKKARLEASISNQVKNMRDAGADLKRFIQEDIQNLSDELREVDILLEKLEDSKRNQMYAVRNIEEIKERLLSFGKYAEDAQPDVLVTLIQSFVERIYIVDENNERYCHIFIKGCTKEDYEEFFRATGYISDTDESGAITAKLSLCDSDGCCKAIILSKNLHHATSYSRQLFTS